MGYKASKNYKYTITFRKGNCKYTKLYSTRESAISEFNYFKTHYHKSYDYMELRYRVYVIDFYDFTDGVIYE